MPPGRTRCIRRTEKEPDVTYFKPRGAPLRELEVVILRLEGLEAIRLVFGYSRAFLCKDENRASRCSAR